MTLWRTIPTVDPSVEVSLLIATRMPRSQQKFDAAVMPLIELLRVRCGGAFEVVVAPFAGDVTIDVAHLAEARMVPPQHRFFGRGDALRVAFLAARGKTILTLDPEQPCDPHFFLRAYDAILGGADFVRANRRLSATRFRIPVSVLPKVYQRHQLGVAFNFIVRSLLPIDTSDTQAGNLAISRRMAVSAFSLQRARGFLFYVELSLIAATHEYTQIDFPELLFLQEEKTTWRVSREVGNIAGGLPAIVWRYITGYYSKLQRPTAITADDWGLSPAINRGIVDLVRAGVVRRVSMLAGGDHVHDHLDELRALAAAGEVQLGLHFNLTHGPLAISPATFLGRWMRATGERKRELVAAVRAQLTSQLAALKSAGVETRYVDGHHHIHLTPGLLAAVSDILRDAGISEVRIPYDPALWKSRKAAINVLAILARGAAVRAGLRYRRCYYPSMRDFLDHGKLRRKIARSPEAEIIVHPAAENDFERYRVADDYAAGRTTEYQALQMLAANLA
jgi:predicted glycoside hydrolase/deacetylase ChbG (UPF0249 family)